MGTDGRFRGTFGLLGGVEVFIDGNALKFDVSA